MLSFFLRLLWIVITVVLTEVSFIAQMTFGIATIALGFYHLAGFEITSHLVYVLLAMSLMFCGFISTLIAYIKHNQL